MSHIHQRGDATAAVLDIVPSRISTYERVLRGIGHTGLPGVSRLVRNLAPAYNSSRYFISDFFGFSYIGDLSELIDWHIFFLGGYAKAELALLDRCAFILSKRHCDINFFDIGANSGQHSLFMCRKAQWVHAFEPSAAMVERFLLNASVNSLHNVVLHPIGLADFDSEATLGSGFKGNSGSRSLNWSLPGEPSERVQVKEGDAYFYKRRLPRMHLLKIDVEGHEKKVLRGLRDRLHADRPVIVMELIGPQYCKGGFNNEEDLSGHLYPEHSLRSLIEYRGRYRLTEFDWNCETAVVLPREVCEFFREHIV